MYDGRYTCINYCEMRATLDAIVLREHRARGLIFGEQQVSLEEFDNAQYVLIFQICKHQSKDVFVKIRLSEVSERSSDYEGRERK